MISGCETTSAGRCSTADRPECMSALPNKRVERTP